MPSYFSYIGDIEDPDFAWDKPNDAKSSGNLPRRVVPLDRWKHFDFGVGAAFVFDMIKQGRYEGRQLDWGAWGLKLTGREIRAILTNPRDAELLSTLEADKSYVLVVAESVF